MKLSEIKEEKELLRSIIQKVNKLAITDQDTVISLNKKECEFLIECSKREYIRITDEEVHLWRLK